MTDGLSTSDVIRRLEEASTTLGALQVQGLRPAGVRSNMPEFVRTFEEAYGWDGSTVRPARPSPREIAAMDEALAWYGFIPDDQRVLRRIVGARSITHHANGRYIYSWRAIGRLVGADHHAVQRWHDKGITIIGLRLAGPGLCLKTGGPIGPSSDAIAAAVRRLSAKRRLRHRELV